jgi:glutathione transport system permease protein
MSAYILRRAAAGLATLLAASLVLFLLVSLSGTTAAGAGARPDGPVLVRYWSWLDALLHGSFGTSANGQPVGPQLWPLLLITLRMVVPATVLAVIAGVAAGVVGAVRQHSAAGHVSAVLAYLFYSTPVFVIAIVLKEFLAVDVNRAVGHTVLYTVGQNRPGVTGTAAVLTDSVAHTVLPVLALVLTTYAPWSRYQRAALLDVFGTGYIRLARAKGLSPRRVLFVHALRNALVPVITVIALDFAVILGGAVITEIVFGWQGMGQFLRNGLTSPHGPDVNVVQAWLVVAATAVLIVNILADIACGLLDPRVRRA